MKKLLLVMGIAARAAAALSLAFAAGSLYGYYHVLDGPAELFARLRHRAAVQAGIGAVLAAAGGACLIVRSRL